MAVNHKDKLFLTVEDALASIQQALFQYSFSLNLLSTLWPLVFGDDSYFQQVSRTRCLWVKLPDQKKLVKLRQTELKELVAAQLQKSVPDLDRLAELCRLIFGVPVTIAYGKENDVTPGVWIETDMDRFVCTRCGHCCRSLEYKNGASRSDYQRWQNLDRQDILDRVSVVRDKGQIILCRIWIDPVTNDFTEICPWLEKIPDRNEYRCKIHDLRPRVCRQYPGSRKHARLTGCKGVFK